MKPLNSRKRLGLACCAIIFLLAALLLPLEGFRYGFISVLIFLWVTFDANLQEGSWFRKPLPKEVDSRFWLQKADGNMSAIKDETREGIMAAFLNVDWATEMESRKKLGKRESVPPGLGLGGYGDDFFVHVTMLSRDEMDVLVMKRKEPGNAKSKYKQIHRRHVPFKDVDRIVKAYLANDANAIAEIIHSDQRV